MKEYTSLFNTKDQWNTYAGLKVILSRLLCYGSIFTLKYEGGKYLELKIRFNYYGGFQIGDLMKTLDTFKVDYQLQEYELIGGK